MSVQPPPRSGNSVCPSLWLTVCTNSVPIDKKSSAWLSPFSASPTKAWRRAWVFPAGATLLARGPGGWTRNILLYPSHLWFPTTPQKSPHLGIKHSSVLSNDTLHLLFILFLASLWPLQMIPGSVHGSYRTHTQTVSAIWCRIHFIYWHHHPSHVAAIDISQALALRKLLFTGDWTSPEQDDHRSSAQDTSESVGLGPVGAAEFLSTTVEHLNLHPPLLLVGSARSRWILTLLADNPFFPWGQNPTNFILRG